MPTDAPDLTGIILGFEPESWWVPGDFEPESLLSCLRAQAALADFDDERGNRQAAVRLDLDHGGAAGYWVTVPAGTGDGPVTTAAASYVLVPPPPPAPVAPPPEAVAAAAGAAVGAVVPFLAPGASAQAAAAAQSAAQAAATQVLAEHAAQLAAGKEPDLKKIVAKAMRDHRPA